MTTAIDVAVQAAYVAADAKAAEAGAERVDIVQSALAAAVHSLAEAGVLQEPRPQPAPMTTEDAARLLCELSCSVLLSDPAEDYVQLLERPDRVKYAWDQAVGAGIPAADRSRAEEARRVLLAHHRTQS